MKKSCKLIFTVPKKQSGCALHKEGFTHQKKEYEDFVRTPFCISYRARCSVLLLLGVLSDSGIFLPWVYASRKFACFCGFKKQSPAQGGVIGILIKLFYDDFFSRRFITKTESA